VFARFELSDQLRSSADPTNNFGVINVADPDMHRYYGDFNIVIFVGFYTLSFYAIIMDVVSLFADSFFLFLANLYCIDILYRFELIDGVYFL